MKRSKLSPKQTIALFLAVLTLFASIACTTPQDNYGCPNCDLTSQNGGF